MSTRITESVKISSEASFTIWLKPLVSFGLVTDILYSSAVMNIEIPHSSQGAGQNRYYSCRYLAKISGQCEKMREKEVQLW